MNINNIRFNMLVKSNTFSKNVYQVMGIDRLDNKVLLKTIGTDKIGLYHNEWVNPELYHTINLIY